MLAYVAACEKQNHNTQIRYVRKKVKQMKRTATIDVNGVWDNIVGTYSVGQVVVRPVGKVVPALGVFVSLEHGFDALIHVSKIAGLGDQDPRRFYATGQAVKAKVVNIDSRTHRVELATEICEFSFDGFLSGNDQVVVQNANLADIEVTGAVLYGAWIQDRPFARVELVKRMEDEVSLQLQAKCAHLDRQALKCVHVILRQNGNDVIARADWAAYTTTEHDYGYDLTGIAMRESPNTDNEGRANVATSADIESEDSQGYGVAKLYFRRKPAIVEQAKGEGESCIAKCEMKPILVDGSNIVRRWPSLRSEALAGLLEGLKEGGYAPTVFFDANIAHVLQNAGDVFGQNLLECLLREDPEHTIIVPAGTRSDDYMLLLADRRGYPILSCDTYRDEAFAKYSWLRNRVESGEKRVHAPAFVLGDLVIPTLDIVWPFTRLSSEKFPQGGEVFIQAFSNGEYFCADGEEQETARRIMANRDNPSDWEKFVLSRNADGTVSVKAKVNGKFLSVEAEADGRMNAQADEIREREKFWLARREDNGRYVLRSFANMKYVSTDPDTGLVAAQSDVAKEWEWLNIAPCS